MLELTRTVRFSLNGDAGDADSPRDNTFAGWPAMRGLGRYYELSVTCRGEADPATGYFINIKQIDSAVRDHVLPLLNRAIATDAAAREAPLGGLMHETLRVLQPSLRNSVTSIELRLTPFYRLAARTHDMQRIIIKQQYEFSAAHRLHVPSFSDEKNREVFGKCNNPEGHGHNYKIEVAVDSPVDEHGKAIDAAELDAAVDRHCIEHLDHKHLNHDVPAFADLNPSVENIAQVVWDMLADNLPGGASLSEISVWETGKTVCTYRGQAAASGTP